MAAKLTLADPLTVLPPEIVLRILDFTPIPGLASLTAVSPAWHEFIDTTHQEAIYSSKTTHPSNARDFSFLDDATSFSKIFSGCTLWKELCKRRTLLARNWALQQPVTRESVLQIVTDAVWRFKADFKRRFFLSTSHAGGLNVTDMDTGRILWRLPSTLDQEENAVRHFAHLEYQDGMMVFDREGDAVEVWKHADEGTRGEFQRVAILDHDCQTRGFQLSYWTLVVVSTEGQGFVYDMKQMPPKLTTHLEIEQDAVGHLDQGEDVVVYSMGARGYHIYDKSSGESLGVLQPSHCTEKYHIKPLPSVDSRHSPLGAVAGLANASRHGPTPDIFPPKNPRNDRLVPIEVVKGPLPLENPDNHTDSEDEWGAGMLDRDSDLFVGFSRSGRVFICSDFHKALSSPANLASHSALLECESDGSSFDLGGWLSVRNHRVMFEVQDRVYIVALDDDNRIDPARASYSMLNSCAPQLTVPVSFMALYDDAIMSTYTTLGWRDEGEGPHRIVPTKAIRILSLAPDLDDNESSTRGPTTTASADVPGDAQSMQASLLQLVSMLGGELSDDDDDGLGDLELVLQQSDEEWADVEDDDRPT